MGLFGTSPQKKLERARALLAGGGWYEAKRLFEEAIEAGARLTEGERTEARAGRRRCRQAMMDGRMTEAETLLRAGDLEGARDRAQTALDLAEDDLPTEELRELLQRIEAPSRPLTGRGLDKAAVRDDLLPEPESTPTRFAAWLERPTRRPEPVSDEEFYGENPEGLFELHLESMSPRAAEYFRSLGEEFRLGYLATVGGDGARALKRFEAMDWAGVRHPAALRAKANALLLAGQAEESLALLDSIAPAGDAAEENRVPDAGNEEDLREHFAGEGERRYLRVEALRALKRMDDAVEAARALADAQPEPRLATEALLGWTLIEAGRSEEAWKRLKARLDELGYHEEILVPAAQAAFGLGDDAEARRMLEELIQFRMQRSLARGTELDFPVEAGRKLLEIYLRTKADVATTRTLVLHLLDHDEVNAEDYRSLLLQLDAQG